MIYREKHNFTAGEISPLMFGRRDFERYKNGCRKLNNVIVLTQGPGARRSGFEYIASLSALGIDPTNPLVRMVPFIFNELQAYVLIFFMHTSGVIRCVFAVDNGLLAYPDPAPTECPTGTPVTLSPGDIMYIDMPAGWDIESFDYAQSGDYLYMVQSSLRPHVLIRNNQYCWTVEALTFTDQPLDWSDVYGWPETVTFVQQRIAFGGTIKDRQTVWMSRAGDFSHLGKLGVDLVDADAIAFTLDSGTQNKIVWMQTVKQLHIGTIGNEWIVSGNGQSAVTPVGGILTESPTNQGSEKVKPLRVGNTTLFVEQHGRIVNEFIYDYNYDSYKASDVTILAPHLTEHFSLIRWAYQQTPNSIIWGVREDGTLLGLTYQRQHNVVAWHPHDTNGKFLDVAAIPGSRREDDLWAVVSREIEGVDVYYIEKKHAEFSGPDAVDGRFLDSSLLYQGAETEVIYGLSHLEGKTVSALVNGSVHPDMVVSSGSVMLDKPATDVFIGLPYESIINPLLSEVPDREGGSATREQRLLGLHIELYRSLGFEIGFYDADKELTIEEQPFRVPTDTTGQPVPLFSGTYVSDGFEGTVRDMEYFIRQRQPLPLTVIGIVDMIEVK